MRRPILSLAVFLIVVCGGSTLFAQINTANLSGIAMDPQGSVVSNVEIKVTNDATGYIRTTRTDAAGFYSFQDLPIGQYTVTVSANGFASETATVTLQVAEKGRQDFHLNIGSTQQTVEVQSAAPLLSPDDASVGTVIDETTIDKTPLYLRNWDDLLRLVPGVQISRYTQQSGNTAAGRTGDFNVNGVHSLQNDFILDGIDNNTFSENVQELSTEAAHPSTDTIAQFNIITNPYSAEYGRSPGAVVSVNTKTGANQFHGLAYEFVRNQYFDANDFISNRSGLSKPENNQNQFGGSFGGPIKKDRLFFFFEYDGTRIKQGVSRVSTVPLPNERIGDFSAATGAAVGVKYPTIYDPLTCSTPYSGTGCAPFPNNKIPQARIDTSVAKLMTLFPLPNIVTPGNAPNLNNFARNALLTDFEDAYDGRVDWTPSEKNTIFVRYNYSNRNRDIPGYLGGLADGSSTSAWGNQKLKDFSAVLGWTHIINDRMVNEFRFGWTRNYSVAVQQPFNLPQVAADFVPGIPVNPAIGGGIPLTTFTNFAFEGSPDYLPKQQIPMQYQYSDALSIILGRQTLKFGVDLYLPMRNLFQDEPGTRGDLTFTGVFSCQHTAPGSCASGTGFAYADGLLGATQSDQLTNVFFVDQRIWMASGFVEDDWKATPTLTVNLGLRYDFATPPYEGKNRMADFDPTSGSLVFAKSGSLQDRTIIHPNMKNFAPRIGISYSVTPTTVVRAGYGIYYDLFERIGSEDQLALNPPNLVNKALSSSITPVLTPAVGFPTNFLDPATINFNNLSAFHVRSVPVNDPASMVQQWSLSIQRQIGTAWVGEVDYIGTKSSHLDVIRNFNQPVITGNMVTGPAPYSNYGQIEWTSPIGYGNYNGLQASLTRRFQKGWNMRFAYTHSRSLDNTPEELETNSGDAPNGRNYATWYGPSDFNVPNRVSASYVYELPFGHGKSMLNHGPLSWVLGNWQTSGVYTYYSGHPFQINENDGQRNNALDPFGYTTAIPYQVGKPRMVNNPTCWFYISSNTACAAHAPSGSTNAYALTPVGVIGNVGRNSLSGPHTSVFDALLLREFPFRERYNVEARWEVFNVTNTPLFGQPQSNITSGSAASITTLSGDPRVMQFALRFTF